MKADLGSETWEEAAKIQRLCLFPVSVAELAKFRPFSADDNLDTYAEKCTSLLGHVFLMSALCLARTFQQRSVGSRSCHGSIPLLIPLSTE